MARNSVKANVDTTLALHLPSYSLVSKCISLTAETALAAIPPLNVCMVAHKTLYGMEVDESQDIIWNIFLAGNSRYCSNSLCKGTKIGN